MKPDFIHPSTWKWNPTQLGDTSLVRVPLERLSSDSESAIIGAGLVEVGSLLGKLHQETLSQSEKGEISRLLRKVFLQLARLSGSTADPTAGSQLVGYVTALGALAVQRCVGDGQLKGEPIGLQEAISHGSALPWVEGYYRAAHELKEQSPMGQDLCFILFSDQLVAERKARADLLHWLELID